MVPALVVGVVSALTLLALSELAGWVQHLVWDRLPEAWGVTTTRTWWTVLVLTLTGVLVGATVRWAPGHAGVDPATKKPNVEVEYNFHQKTADGEKFFNKTEPQVMNAETLPPQFDMAAGHQLPGSLSVPLSSFPEGDYRLEVKLTDKTSGKTVTRESVFNVAAQ